MPTFSNKIALVTGGSSGIGRSAALRLAQQGADVALVGRNSQALDAVAADIAKLGRRALALPTDVRESAACQLAVQKTVETFGGLDLLINSAGLSMRTNFADTALAAMEEVIRVNVFGTLYFTHFALPFVRERKGSLIAVSSMSGLRGIPTYAVYGATKFAVAGLYQSLRLEMKPVGVHVGVLAPAFVDTPLRERVLNAQGSTYQTPPDPPFRIWPVEKCVDRLMTLIVKRRARALLPAFTGPLLAMDQILGNLIGDRILLWKFPKLEAGS